MKIAMVTPGLGFRGGLEKHARDLAIALRQRGHAVSLLHGDGPGRDAAAYAGAFSSASPLRAGARGLDVAYVHRARSAAELLPLGEVPLLLAAHDHELTCVRTSRLLPLRNEPCHRAPGAGCVLRGCAISRDREAPLQLRVASPFRLRARLLQLAERAPIAACSSYVAQSLVRAGVPRTRVRVLHPLPPEDESALVPRPASQRLLVAAQLVRGKGVDLAIAALAHLPHATLEIAGEGPSRAALERLAGRVAPGRVSFLGYVPPEAMGRHYDRASVVAVPSRWPEPFGMSGVEGMRRGRPVAAAAHGGVPEWLTENRGGLLFRPGDARDLARATAALFADAGAGLRALDEARGRLAHTTAVDAAEEALLEIASAASPRGLALREAIA